MSFLRLFNSEGQQRNMPGPFNGHSQGTLMFGAGACLPARPDATKFGDIPFQVFCVFIVDGIGAFHTKFAHALSAHKAFTTLISHNFLQFQPQLIRFAAEFI